MYWQKRSTMRLRCVQGMPACKAPQKARSTEMGRDGCWMLDA